MRSALSSVLMIEGLERLKTSQASETGSGLGLRSVFMVLSGQAPYHSLPSSLFNCIRAQPGLGEQNKSPCPIAVKSSR